MAMIPRVLHHIWLSDEPRPDLVQRCLASWAQVMPGFSIRRWSLADFNLPALPLFVRQAIQVQQWAFATDVLRLWVLQHQGGFYLDADVLAVRSLEPLLGYDFVTAVEFNPQAFAAEGGASLLDGQGQRLLERCPGPPPGIGLQAAVLGAVPQHPFARSCLAYYEHRPFIDADGRWHRNPIAPGIYGLAAEPYGFRWLNQLQKLREGVIVLPAAMIASTRSQYGADTFAFHCCAGSWRTPDDAQGQPKP
jgi:hypothetical protein